MIKIICDGEQTLMDSGVTRVVGYRGIVKIEGDKETVELQLSNVFLELMKNSPELFELALKNAIKELENGKST